MGVEGTKESALLGGRPLRDALRMRLGTTLGGRYEVGGAVGEFHGDAFKGMGGRNGMDGFPDAANSGGNGQHRLNVLPHGQAAAARADTSGMINAGAEGGIPSAASPAAAASSTTSSSSHSSGSGTAAAGGGHH
jgi:hypothetical protein